MPHNNENRHGMSESIHPFDLLRQLAQQCRSQAIGFTRGTNRTWYDHEFADLVLAFAVRHKGKAQAIWP